MTLDLLWAILTPLATFAVSYLISLGINTLIIWYTERGRERGS